ncbi:DNA-binding MarR family transcriptional regulator [Rhodoblastus acidophilus]|uniref:MarR family winged helix-turn-helix transcriptional regulator n=1 Tax=Rhodoblastus acidophilus TaxID=1074 RepID=UPI0022253D12|nr:MarR family transcriptional regulator [Rhodoblastus acidophilus]MCW2285574.1 DNA-binding MarR family transcriptional regulator [Rhodoblastus acidophilus]MCW2334510.1 DNA-binding MarR family transcriptional regulator [Rhodoblastus acidophilus]
MTTEGEFRREDSLGYMVNLLGRLFARALDRRLGKYGVAHGQFPVLLILWEQEGITQSEIARRLDIEQPTVANTLKRMERDDLVTFAADPGNRRQVLIGLTEKGRALKTPLIAEALAVNDRAVEDFEAADRVQFIARLRRMIDALSGPAE